MLYEYTCDNCGFTDGFFHKMDEKPEIRCPKCNELMRKALGLNFDVKCDGFYSSKQCSSEARKITQTVMGVDPTQLDKVDNKIKNKAARAKPVDPV